MRWNHLFKKCVFFLLAALVLITIGCDIRPTTMGYQNRIFVVADSTVWDELKDEILLTFENEIYTPHTEKSFEVLHIPLSKLNDYKERMNIFFVGFFEQAGPVNEYMMKILPENFKQGVEDERYFYVFNDNLFARDQIGVIMYAKNANKFRQYFSEMKQDIYDEFEKKYYARLKKTMFDRDEQKSLSKTVLENYGWTLRLQHDYMVAIQDIENNYIWLRRYDPDRWISIWSIEGDSSLFNYNSLIKARNKTISKYYEGDVVVEDETRLDTVLFQGSRTHKIIGTWMNDSLRVGGPFRTYAIKNPQSPKIYFVDIAVMAPGKLKKPFLDQLEVIAGTFEVVDDR